MPAKLSGLGHFNARQFLRANWPPPELAVSIRQPAAKVSQGELAAARTHRLEDEFEQCDFNSSVELTQPRFWTRFVITQWCATRGFAYSAGNMNRKRWTGI
jgi:hypothetical protein